MRLLLLPLLAVCASAQSAAPVKPHTIVFAGDDVIPQVVDGAGWKTTFKFVNLENHVVTFTLFFIGDGGQPMALPILGSSFISAGTYSNIIVTLNVAGSITIETVGTASTLSQGWGLMQQSVTTDSIGGFAIFRQHVAGIADQEATVPVVNQFSGHFVLMFDNTQTFVTGIAIANPTSNTVAIPVTIRNQLGQIIDQESLSLGPYAHTAFVLPSMWSSTAGTAGAIEFLASGFGVGALGLRFNGPAFTSFAVLENFAWLPTQ